MSARAQMTLFTARKRLTKLITRGEDGRLAKESAALSRGDATRVEVTNARELAEIIEGLSPEQCLAYGITERLTARIAPRDYLKPGEISRSRDNFTWPQGPGVLFLDLDGEHDAEDVPRLREILEAAMPELAAAPQVWTRSSSGGIRDTITGQTYKGGLHCYIIIGNGSAVPRVGRQLYDALWLAGYGHHELSNGENPAALERCLVDDCAFQPERLDYAAAPVVRPPLERVGGVVVGVVNPDAAPLDPAAIEPLSAAQEAAVSAAKGESKARILEGVKRARAEILIALPAEQREQQRRRWLAMDRRNLTPDAPIILDSGQTITAAEILAAPETYNGMCCYDPQEPNNSKASPSQAKIYADERGCRVWSFAHGGRLFRIVEGEPDLPDNVLMLPPEPDASAVVGACYRHRATASEGGMQAACNEVGASLDYATQVWADHLREQAAPLHASTTPKETYELFEHVADMFDLVGESTFCIAPMGSGKTRELGGRVVGEAKREGRPVLTVTVLRALTWQNAETFSAAHYTDEMDFVSAAEVVSTTVHSLDSGKLDGFLTRLEDRKGVVVIDEAAAVSELLFAGGGILEDRQRYAILRRLEQLVRAGVQFLMLDGDATPCASILAEMLGCVVVECLEQPHPDPRADVYPVQRVEEGEKQVTATPCHADIMRALAAGERVVLATDSKEQAERMHTVYAPFAAGGALCIHADNADLPDQSAFRNNPNEQAQRWQLVTYSPVLSVGVSVTSVEAHVFAFASAGTLDAAGMWQLARRYRRAAGGVVRFVVEPHLCHPRRQRLGLRAVTTDVRSHAQALGAFQDAPELRGMVAAYWQRNLYDANPLHALVGHLDAAGIVARVTYSTDTSGTAVRKEARDHVRQARIERIATAETLDRADAEVFEKTATATPGDQARLARHRLELALQLGEKDSDADGTLDRDLVEAAQYANLTSRVRRLAWLLNARAGVDLEDNVHAALVPGYAYMRHTNAQAGLMIELLEQLRDESGELKIDADKARTVADQFRRRIHVAYADLPKPPGRKAGAARCTRWLRDLLTGWGLECIRREQVREGAERGKRIYTYQEADGVMKYATRFTVREEDFESWETPPDARHFDESVEHPNALEPAF